MRLYTSTGSSILPITTRSHKSSPPWREATKLFVTFTPLRVSVTFKITIKKLPPAPFPYACPSHIMFHFYLDAKRHDQSFLMPHSLTLTLHEKSAPASAATECLCLSSRCVLGVILTLAFVGTLVDALFEHPDKHDAEALAKRGKLENSPRKCSLPHLFIVFFFLTLLVVRVPRDKATTNLLRTRAMTSKPLTSPPPSSFFARSYLQGASRGPWLLSPLCRTPRSCSDNRNEPAVNWRPCTGFEWSLAFGLCWVTFTSSPTSHLTFASVSIEYIEFLDLD